MKAIMIMGIMFFFHYTLFSQEVPNGNFENWSSVGNYQSPNFWDTPNSTTSSLSTFTVIRESSIVQSGNYSAKLQSKSVFGFTIPGLVTLGSFNFNMITQEATISGGRPFTWRPESLTGYIQYEPKFNDECFIGVLILKQNGNQWDTIGTGEYKTTATLLNWTQFTAPITYTSNDTPTHLNIIIMPSDRNSPQPNSTLYIDNLQFNYPANTSKHNTTDIVINMINNYLSIEHPNMSCIHHIHVIDLSGKTVYLSNSYHQSIALNHLSKGLYLLYIQMRDFSKITRKIIIQ